MSSLAFIIFVLGVALEVGFVFYRPLWRFKELFSILTASLIGSWTAIILFNQLSFLNLLILIVGLYRVFSLSRLGRPSADENRLWRAARRSSVIFIIIQAVFYALNFLNLSISWSDSILLLAINQLLASFFILGVTARNLLKTKHHNNAHFYSDKELPTLSVAIPARNETSELASCLETILASNYPKLEVLVLDDCSQDKTSDIIRSFAQDGVRFIEGQPPMEKWLAKNQSYEQLAAAASGELILFCGVDVRFGPESIRAIVTTALNKKRDMLSIMPLRAGGGVRTAFIQPMRYWWELALPRRLFNKPPVLSTCWLIKRRTLKKLGGFAAVSRTIIPEGFFARELVKSDSYAFVRADEVLEVKTVKSVSAQLHTAVRTRYPQLRKRPENVLLLSFAEVALLLAPFILAVLSFWVGTDTVTWLALLSSVMLIITHYLIMSASNPANSVIALVNFPLVVLTEIMILHISMYRYEFSVVEWKGRNICIPVMRIIPKLPGPEH